jgi:hypothetical protein
MYPSDPLHRHKHMKTQIIDVKFAEIDPEDERVGRGSHGYF